MSANIFTGLDFTSGWTPGNASVTTGRTDPFGGTSAAKLIPNTSVGVLHNLSQTVGKAASSLPYVCHIVAKAAGYNGVWLFLDNGSGADVYAGWDTSTNTLIYNGIDGAGFGYVRSSATAYAGWSFCELVLTSSADAFVRLQIIPMNNSNQIVFTGDGTSGVDLYLPELIEVDSLMGQPVF